MGTESNRDLLGRLQSIGSFQRLNQTIMLPDSYPYIEIKEAYLGFQDMLEKLQSVEKSEKEAAIGRVIRQISHDLRAPLGVFENLLHLPDDSKMLSQKLQIQDSLHRMYAMIESVRHADLELMIDAKYCSLNFHGGLSGLMGNASSVNKTLTLSLTDIGQVKVDSLKFERAWVNLVSNAIDCAKSQVVLEVERQGVDLVVRVVDDGPGVSDEIRPKLFQRGATHGKSDGTGLGLAYVRHIMQGHGGDVSYRRENGLTIFECRLPDACDAEGGIAVKKLVQTPEAFGNRLVRQVAICLEPPCLGASVRSALTSQKSLNFIFSGELTKETEIVVTNVDEIAIQALESDKEIFQMNASLSEGQIIERLIRKFIVQA